MDGDQRSIERDCDLLDVDAFLDHPQIVIRDSDDHDGADIPESYPDEFTDEIEPTPKRIAVGLALLSGHDRCFGGWLDFCFWTDCVAKLFSAPGAKDRFKIVLPAAT